MMFTIEPRPRRDSSADADTYAVYVGPDMDAPEMRVFSIADWSIGPNELLYLGRTSANAGSILPVRLPVDGQEGETEVPASAQIDLDWMRVSLCGAPGRGTLVATLYVQESDDDFVFRCFNLEISLTDAVEFGRAFEEEVIHASPSWAKEWQLA